MGSGVNKLKRRKGQIISQVERFIEFIENEQTKGKIESRLNTLKPLWDTFDEVQNKIEALDIEEEDPEQQKNKMNDWDREREYFEEQYHTAVGLANDELDKLNSVNRVPEENERNDLPQIAPGAPRSINYNFPVLNLPKFNGNYDKWLLFKDTFTATVDTNQDVQTIIKLQYLRGSLEGDALQLISSISTSADNYTVAWELLKARYDNKRLIINTHMKQLLEFPTVTRGNHTSLRSLIDHIQTHTQALKNLQQPVDQWSTILIHLITNKLDFETRRDWEVRVNNADFRANQNDPERPEPMPSLDQLIQFLTRKCRTLELVEEDKNSYHETNKYNNARRDKRVTLASTTDATCNFCNGPHFNYHCEEFRKLDIPTRISEIKQKHSCLNCLARGHFNKECRASSCKRCGKRHHSLLHLERNMISNNENNSRPGESQPVTTICAQQRQSNVDSSQQSSSGVNLDKIAPAINHFSQTQRSSFFTVLSTALIDIYDSEGNIHTCRALLDTGSQPNMITTRLLNRLKIPCKNVDLSIIAVTAMATRVNKSAKVKIKSKFDNNSTAILECLVTSQITIKLPQVPLDRSQLNVPGHIRLADPSFDRTSDVDLLIGAGLFWKIINGGQISLGKNKPVLQKTKLGWIVGGDLIEDHQSNKRPVCNFIALDQQLEKFWNLEEIVKPKVTYKDEKYREDYFLKTVERNDEGRFIVRLPQDPGISLGDSRAGALRRLQSLEYRLNKNPSVKFEYHKFLREYQDLGYMTMLDSDSISENEETYYIPHQPVMRTSSLTTKLRVVFDASAKSSNGISLNKKLLPGPNLQQDLTKLILRFRGYQYVMTADITKMYRQILVSEKDRSLQQILWRENPQDQEKTYSLNTLTYGTSPAPFLAMRCLKRLVEEDGKDFPLATRAVSNDFFMDDLLTGTDSLPEAIGLCRQISQLLQRGQFPLRKWRSNDARVLENLSKDNSTDELLILDGDEALKTLGVLWNAKTDTLQYHVTLKEENKITERKILSCIAQTFDPLGLIGPVTTNGKLIMQRLWDSKLDWDTIVPDSLQKLWKAYYSSLIKLNDFNIPRSIVSWNILNKIILHGFGDASGKAYGGCLYAVTTNENGEAVSTLICSESRVTPLKALETPPEEFENQTIPRLELNAALLLIQLTEIVREAYGDKILEIHLWIDSMVALYWIATPHDELKTYEANRVKKIQELSSGVTWHHVPTSENPSDLLSRGITPEKLLSSDLWFKGPTWLATPNQWPELPNKQKIKIPELKKEVVSMVSYTAPKILTRFGNYGKLQRVIGYCIRFLDNYLRKKNTTGPLTPEELQRADCSIVGMVQQECFPNELKSLKTKKDLDHKSKLIQLAPFLDEKGIIRVGGRLHKAKITIDQKHPFVIPSKHHVTTMILTQEHVRLLHCGPEQLLSSVRYRYWPLSGRREARKVTRKCVNCFKVKPRTLDMIMASLPESRVSGNLRPFTRTGIDYAGPIQIRESRRRGRVNTTKGYIAVFVCLSCKAVHLELVTELTTDAFLAALTRFISRRGICSEIQSDNGTNFVGAERELREMYEFVKTHEREIQEDLAAKRIQWKFIPPRAPHFGGLWEAAVKSMKKHFYTLTKGSTLTFEECYTLLTQIEAVLNSRPLCPNPSDPCDLIALTPSHFLIGDSLVEPVQASLLDTPDNRLSCWQHLTKIKQHFWSRWSSEYLSQLQTRGKWVTGGKNIKKGTLVLLKEDNVPPLQWHMGRVAEIHPGKDNVVRVVTVRTMNGTLKRAVKKLCSLPIED